MGKEDKKLNFRSIVRFIAAISAFLAVFCLTLPSARKKNSLSMTGGAALEEMSAAATAISYYSADEIERLAESPKLDAACKYIAGLLAQLKTQHGYEKTYILSRDADKKLCYLIDGSYRDNGKAGTDYFAPATAYHVDNGYKAVKSVADKIYSNKLTGGYANEIVTNSNRKDVVVSCLPIYGTGHTAAAILCIESDPGNTAFNMIGGIDLYIIGWCSAAVTLLCFAFFIFRRKFISWRENRRENQKNGKSSSYSEEENTAAENYSEDEALISKASSDDNEAFSPEDERL